ncbi:MAG TPA: hypothetical protein PKE69_22240 [Pyrinomonadaceae bacterium]|nr:hypothetical protein [Pyrinomonadaceae bacterium]
MPENAEEKNIAEEKSEKNDENEERSYYYDDACGYEIYQPDEEIEENA